MGCEAPSMAHRVAALVKAATALILALGAVAAAHTPQRSDGEPLSQQLRGSKPNVLVLFADDLGYGDLGFTGHPTNPTPNLDSLAAASMRFAQSYSSFHVCSPSRGSMMTGRLPIRTGTAGASWTGGVFASTAVGGLPTNETTMADLLKGQGYVTAAIGKWHLGQRKEYLPTSRGFDSYYGIPYSDDMGSSAWKKTGYPPLPLVLDESVVEQPTDLNKLSDRYVARATEVMANASSAGKPFLVYMAFNHVHTPDFANQRFCNVTRRGRFGDALTSMDDAVGKIMAAIPDPANTVVTFTSDNGPWLNQGLSGGSAGLLRGGKETTWEGGVREPAFWHWPGKITPSINMEVTTTYDIMPTLAALAGASLPTDRVIDGKDIGPVLFDGAATPHDCLFIYKGTPGLACPSGHPNCPGLWAVRCGAYKAHYVTTTYEDARTGTFQEPPLLFNVEVDPSEAHPVDNKTTEYATAMNTIDAAKAAHLATLTPVPNMMQLGTDAKYAVCCDNGWPAVPSSSSAPSNCSCTPENYNVFVCTPVGSDSSYPGTVSPDVPPSFGTVPFYQDA